jgi:nucleotide-binding universal stress UspA family protein
VTVTYRRIVVPLDGSDASTAAFQPAVRLARLLGVGVDLITVSPAEEATVAARMLDDVRTSLGSPVPDIAAEVLVGSDAASEVARHADRCEGLVCMSTRGRGSVGRALFGSVSRDLVRVVRTGVVVVGPACATGVAQDIDRLVACIDGTTRGERAVDVAARWSRMTDLPILIAHVVYPLVDPKARVAPTERELRSLAHATHVAVRLEAEGHAVLPLTLQDADVEGAIGGVSAQFPTSLLIVATAESTGVSGLVAGSTAAAVVSRSTTPVLLVRHEDT